MANRKLIKKLRAEMWRLYTALQITKDPDRYLKLVAEGADLARQVRKMESGKTNVIHNHTVNALLIRCGQRKPG